MTAGPARLLLAKALPTPRQVQDDYREAVERIRVLGGPSNPGTIGSAFDVWVQLHTLPRPELDLVTRGARLVGPAVADACDLLLDRLGPPVTRPEPSFAGPWTGPAESLAPDELLRLCWAAGCLVEVFRVGGVAPGSPLSTVARGRVTVLLELAPQAAVDELAELSALASTSLLPGLQTLAATGPTWPNPVFAGSTFMPADADLVVGHTLVEVKTVLGRKATGASGGRKAALDAITLYQLVGYVLHDYDNALAISSVALYQARYGHLAIWDLQDLLDQLAGRPVDLPELRKRWHDLLVAGKPLALS